MIRVENIGVYNMARAVYSARNAMNSWDKSDSDLENDILGEYDLELAKKLYKAGSSHRKYLRQTFVVMDIVSNHTFWSEFDTYKVGVVRNSCSKMHRIHVKPFEAEDFTHEYIDKIPLASKAFKDLLVILETLRIKYNETHDMDYWRAMIDLLPMGYNLRATVTMDYENVVNIIEQRSGHKMYEWRECTEILKDLPYVREIMGLAPKNPQIPGQMTIEEVLKP